MRHKRFLLCLIFLISILNSSTQCHAQEEDPMNPAWDRYHSTEETHSLLRTWAQAFPDLTKLYVIGKTLEGTDLMVMEITNKKTGEAATKPAYYYDGNIHAGELTGAEVALHYAWYVLNNYKKSKRIKNLLDSRVLYIRPKFNPDGADLALQTPTVLRSTPRPYDEDFDGLLDEDPGNDLDGNGIITQMRIKNPEGKFQISSSDPRIMEPRLIGSTGDVYYDIYTEGIDDDKDGEYNEDGIGGIDMNRNFPRNWGLEFEQKGAGPYPLSEPETRATIEFINSKRNITGVFHGHTSGGILFRLPSTTSWDNYDLSDQQLILELSDKYHTTTGQRVIPSYSNPRLHRHGTLISWSYWDFGVVAFVPEFWGGFVKDYDDDGTISENDNLTWNDTNLNGSGFINWKSFDHPVLGSIEIGGWDRKFTFQNPPTKFLKEEIEQYIEWMLWLAEISPLLKLNDITVTSVEKGKVVKLSVDIQNVGYLPTNITQRAIEATINAPVRAIIELENAELISGKRGVDLGHIPGSRDSDQSSSESKRQLEYGIKITGKDATAKLTVQSEKGGTVVRTVALN